MGTEEALQQQAHKLAERVKELDCLYGISNLIETPDTSKLSYIMATSKFRGHLTQLLLKHNWVKIDKMTDPAYSAEGQFECIPDEFDSMPCGQQFYRDDIKPCRAVAQMAFRKIMDRYS